MTAGEPFRQKFHDSEAVGPQELKHWMYKTHASRFAIAGLAIYGLVVFGLVIGVILSEFPEVIVTPNQGAFAAGELESGRTNELVERRREWEVGLLKLVLCFGAVGGLLHLLTSLGRFVGGRTLERSWGLFYLLRPPIGAALGLLVYFILRMSALGQGDEAEIPAVNVYGVLAVSGLAGMFSRQAIEKLAEVFDVLFQKTMQEPSARVAALPGRSDGGNVRNGEREATGSTGDKASEGDPESPT